MHERAVLALAGVVLGMGTAELRADLITNISYQRQLIAVDRFVGQDSAVLSNLLSGTGTLAPTTQSIITPNGSVVSATSSILDNGSVAVVRYVVSYELSYRDGFADSSNFGNPLGTYFRTVEDVEWTLTVTHTAAATPLSPIAGIYSDIRDSDRGTIYDSFDNSLLPDRPSTHSAHGVWAAGTGITLVQVPSGGVFLPLGGPFAGSMWGESQYTLTMTRAVPGPGAACALFIATGCACVGRRCRR